MNLNKEIKVLVLIAILLLLGFLACHKEEKKFSKTVVLRTMIVNVFSSDKPDGSTRKWQELPENAALYEMKISGHRINSKIVMDKDVAWHELQHRLNLEDSEFADPDKL